MMMKSSEFHAKLLPHSSRLFRLAFRMLHNREEAEDAVQEVYLKLWKMRDQLEDYESVEGLAFRITSNHCLDVLRRRSTGWEVMEQQKSTTTSTDDRDPSDLMEKQERAEMVHRMINRLSEPQRTLVYMRHIEGKDYNEIADAMEMTENAIRVSISRARKEMKKMFVSNQDPWKNKPT